MYIYYNPNPDRKLVDDCVIRAICKITGKSWERVYAELSAEGLVYHDWPVKNYIWGSYLERLGFRKTLLPDTCPKCYTVRDFCYDFPVGCYILAIGDHTVTVCDGDYFDTWDSGNEVPIYYWKKERRM